MRFFDEDVGPSKFKTPREIQQWRRETGQTSSARRTSGFASDESEDQEGDIHSTYNIERESLGAGAYGVCRKALRISSGEVRAVKTINKSRNRRMVEWAQEEVRIMRLLEHPNILTLHEVFEDAEAIYLVVEYCAGGSLVDKIKDGGYFTEVQAIVLMEQILRTVDYVHDMRICHRDIKPDNFLLFTTNPLERNILKMIDFGISCSIEPGKMLFERAGTPHFTAPEVIKGRYNEACDLWSCGVMLFIFLCGETPFTGRRKEEVFASIERGNFQFVANAWRKVTAEAKDLVRGLMTYDPKERLKAWQALGHAAIRAKMHH